MSDLIPILGQAKTDQAVVLAFITLFISKLLFIMASTLALEKDCGRRNGVARVAVAVFLGILGSPTHADDRVYTFPLRAEVYSDQFDGVAVRTAPPYATAFRYRLAERVCALANGSEVVATDSVKIANGEVWYRVYISSDEYEPLGDSGCPVGQPLWMVAETTSRRVLRILEEGVTEPTPVREATAGSGTAEEGKEGTTFLWDYVLLFLGGVVAVYVVNVHRHHSLFPRSWPLSFVVFELIVLSLANCLFCSILKKELYAKSENWMLVSMLQLVESAAGFALLGFVLGIFLIRFMTFAKS